ncbi:hypothetical protein NDU88_012008 [Pleurodeles waltl]|uniref:Uncharacterized protein n=1 Tax=Pleurodeles waltl TaxID=8319 RepID=A0AAV7S618_PLEWA|nr:hypothetical protein NDU88_012008 [Pleurodeles waltl]
MDRRTSSALAAGWHARKSPRVEFPRASHNMVEKMSLPLEASGFPFSQKCTPGPDGHSFNTLSFTGSNSVLSSPRIIIRPCDTCVKSHQKLINKHKALEQKAPLRLPWASRLRGPGEVLGPPRPGLLNPPAPRSPCTRGYLRRDPHLVWGPLMQTCNDAGVSPRVSSALMRCASSINSQL